ASLGFRQDADDLFFGESLFHCRSSLERTLHRHRTKRGEQVTTQMRPFFLTPPSVNFRTQPMLFACISCGAA
ncbi:hypothetical protein, partial [Burkholderia pseudomallei]|uniref:hypothetical protein n=1 Tax=Burkholderia pseudomallei TaxID=28450 RepID=UPI001C4CDF92